MSPLAIALLLALLSSIRFLFFTFFRTRGQRLPPGPRPMPIIGNLHLLATGNLPHQTLSNLAKKHGPIMSIKLGSVRTIVVSSPKAAELFLRTHDSVFASRPKLQISEIMSYGTKAMGFTEYGPYWRNVRRLCVSQLLNASKVALFRPLRTKEVESTVKMVKESAEKGKLVNVSRTLAEMFENLMCKVIVGRGMNAMNDDDDDDDDGELKLKENIEELGALAGAFNVSDLLPFLAPFDLQVC